MTDYFFLRAQRALLDACFLGDWTIAERCSFVLFMSVYSTLLLPPLQLRGRELREILPPHDPRASARLSQRLFGCHHAHVHVHCACACACTWTPIGGGVRSLAAVALSFIKHAHYHARSSSNHLLCGNREASDGRRPPPPIQLPLPTRRRRGTARLCWFPS